MNDEATTHYSAIIDNMGLGMKFLKDTFGICSLKCSSMITAHFQARETIFHDRTMQSAKSGMAN